MELLQYTFKLQNLQYPKPPQTSCNLLSSPKIPADQNQECIEVITAFA